MSPVIRRAVPMDPVFPVFDQMGDGSKTNLGGLATYSTDVFHVGGLYRPHELITDTNADAEYIAAGWFADVYAFANVPGHIELHGAGTQISATTYRQLTNVVVVHSNVATFFTFRIPTAFFQVIYANGSTGQGSFDFSVLIRGN